MVVSPVEGNFQCWCASISSWPPAACPRRARGPVHQRPSDGSTHAPPGLFDFRRPVAHTEPRAARSKVVFSVDRFALLHATALLLAQQAAAMRHMCAYIAYQRWQGEAAACAVGLQAPQWGCSMLSRHCPASGDRDEWVIRSRRHMRCTDRGTRGMLVQLWECGHGVSACTGFCGTLLQSPG